MKMLRPPSVVRGLTVLNKKLFDKEIRINCFQFDKSEKKDVKLSSVVPVMKKYLLKLQKFKPIESHGDLIKIHLNPNLVKNWQSFPAETQEELMKNNLSEADLINTNFVIKYENYGIDDVFKAVLPEDNEGFSSYTIIGHIVHVNLRSHLLPYKSIMGDVLYDKVPTCKSVVNKIDIIDTDYRYFNMEILKGTDDMLVELKQNNCKFKFDFSRVYFNPRLGTEHERIVGMLKTNDVLFDVFAGVGPFSVPCAKKGCTVFANDLNPDAFDWLKFNADLNKVQLNASNKDGKDFILEDIKLNLPRFFHQNVFIVMNLPGLACDFLKYFDGLLNEVKFDGNLKNITLVVYCFAKGEDFVKIARDSINGGFGFEVDEKIIDIFKVRTVSTNKEMMRVSINLDEDILLRKINILNNKRKKIDEDDINNTCNDYKKKL